MSSNPLLTTRCARWLALLERTARGTAPWRPSPRYVPRYHPRPRAPDVPLQRDVQGGTARDARLGRAKRDRQGRAPSQEPLRGGARAVERGDGPALLPRDARAPYAGGVRSGQPATRPGRGRGPLRRRHGAHGGHAQDGAPGAAARRLRHAHERARRARAGAPGGNRCRRRAGAVVPARRARLRAVARALCARRRRDRAGGGRARALQRGGRGSALPPLRTDLGPAAPPPPAPRVRRSRGPERPASGATAARCLARGRPPPPRRPLRPLPPGRGGPTFGPGLLGASRVGTPHSNSDSLRRFVIGTAGHIDHGKTALVKALTGVDTDRWEEEKRRGITIDLGFAPLPLGGDVQASVVDVPGHEGFVRNMLAGATGIDVALLVIAADEGIMPQTEEHL